MMLYEHPIYLDFVKRYAFEPIYHFTKDSPNEITFNPVACGTPIKEESIARTYRKQCGAPKNGSGIETFRGSNNGLWMNYDVKKVAHIDAWKKNPQLVLDFYNMRKNDMMNVKPNLAHEIIAELEKDFDVTVVTQNVDDLHEKAGSTKVIHLHGELSKVRSENSKEFVYTYDKDIEIGDLAEDGYQLRPDITWFGE